MKIPFLASHRSLRTAGLMLVTSLLTCSAGVLTAPAAPTTSLSLPAHVAGQLLVHFASGVPSATQAKVLAQSGATVTEKFSTGWLLVKVASTEKALASLQARKEVSAVQPNLQFSVPRPIREQNAPRTTKNMSTRAVAPNDPQYPLQWALQKVNAPEAWKTTKGSDAVIVAVLDGGMNVTHKDLAANIWTNTKEIPGNGKDDDKNGYVDDIHGWNAADMSGTLNKNDHANHCAGIIGAVGNNRFGITGINWRVKMMSISYFSDANPNYTSAHIMRSIDYMLALRKHGVNVRAVSCSFFWNTINGFAEGDSYKALARAGVLIVRAAGNGASNIDAQPDPLTKLKIPNLITVGASDYGDGRAPFSNFGVKNVDIFAPGRGIISAIASSDTAFDNYSGTSMATPLVAGAAALLWSSQPGLSAGAVKARLLASASRVDQLRPFVADGRRLNVGALLDNAVHTIRGTVTGPLKTNSPETRVFPLAGVAIYLDNSKTPTVLTDARGNYIITGVAGGSHTVKAVMSGIKFPAPTPVALPTDKTATPSVYRVDIAAQTEQSKLYVISGSTVRTAPDYSTTPVADVDIYLNDSATPATRSDKGGKFKIDRLPAGGYSLRAVDSHTGEVAPDIKYAYVPYLPQSNSNGNYTVTFTFPAAADHEAPILTPSNVPSGRVFTLATAPKTFEGTVTDASGVDYVQGEFFRNTDTVYEIYDFETGKWLDANTDYANKLIFGKDQKDPKAFNWKFTFPKLEAGYTYGIAVNAIDIWGNYTVMFQGAQEQYIEFDVVASDTGSNPKSTPPSSANGS